MHVDARLYANAYVEISLSPDAFSSAEGWPSQLFLGADLTVSVIGCQYKTGDFGTFKPHLLASSPVPCASSPPSSWLRPALG